MSMFLKVLYKQSLKLGSKIHTVYWVTIDIPQNLDSWHHPGESCLEIDRLQMPWHWPYQIDKINCMSVKYSNYIKKELSFLTVQINYPILFSLVFCFPFAFFSQMLFSLLCLLTQGSMTLSYKPNYNKL